MKAHVIRYGLFGAAGMVLAGLFTRLTLDPTAEDFGGHSAAVGYGILAAVFVVVPLGIRSFAADPSAGKVNYGRALACGLGIALIASLAYAAVWELNFHTKFPDFYERYADMRIADAHKQGMSGSALEELTQSARKDAALFSTFFPRFPFTMLMESFPLGLLISLVSAFIYRHKPATGA
jgi:hypothetical protein